MKKVISISLAAVLSLSISACTPKTSTNPPGTPGTTSGTTTRSLRNGTYTGQGNKTASGNEIATVTISGGKITNITLRRVDANGKEIPITNTTTTPGTTSGITQTTPGTNQNMNAAGGSTPGTAAGNTLGSTPGTTSGTTSGTTNVTPGTTTTPGATTAPGTTTTTPGATTTPGTTTTTPGTTSGVAQQTTVNYYDVRNSLMSAMMKAQSYNVNITAPSAASATIANWKLAVRRALDQARA